MAASDDSDDKKDALQPLGVPSHGWKPPPADEAESTQVAGSPQFTGGGPFNDVTNTTLRASLWPQEGDSDQKNRVGTPSRWPDNDSSVDASTRGWPALDDFDSQKTMVGTTLPHSSEDLTANLSLPTHLRLPSMDFSLPHLPGTEGDAPETPNFSGPTARLNLPNFPQDETVLGGSPPSISPPLPPTPGPQSVPPRRGTESRPSMKALGLPADSDLSLPDLAPPPSKRALTLVSTTTALGARDDAGHRLRWPFVIIGILAVSAVGAFFARERIISILVPKKVHPAAVVAAPPPPTPQEQAKLVFANGVRAFSAKDYPKAIGLFEHALTLDPGLADAQRGLGIVYATTHEQAKAMEHYKQYLERAPQAADVADVRKIIEDYEKAQIKPAPVKEPEAPAKKAHARRHRR